ncbi:MAG TPA: adenylate/guanylate cyclase domain-containing protein [Burkholderiales bacterium]|nr:adenylate/guanylate cyclase domain-containing protein [Burkholderiales bacterium]
MADELQQRRRLAAIMFTDMVGYSALSQENEALALELLNEHRNLLREAFARHGGHEIEAVGDGFFVEFPSALQGTRCAVDIQRTLHDRNMSAPPERRIRVRVGLHLGDVVVQESSVHGDGVNIAARIEPLAEPGGICLSEDIARQIENKIELPLLRLGRADLKNIRTPVIVYRMVLPWERKQFPGSERLAFSMRQRQTRRALIGTGGLLVAGGLAGTWIWMQAQTSAGLVNNRIAVLPFVSMSASTEDEYFVDGITEELISRLSRVQGLEVIARTSIASYKGTKKNIGQIAGELNVGSVLEGSVRTASGKVRISAQLINPNTDAHLWAEDYDRELQDVFAVQRDIAQRVADALALKLGISATAPAVAGTANVGAYNAYLLGRFHYNKGDVEGLHKAVEHYEEAISQDASYAVAYAALADAHEQLAAYEADSANRFPKARIAALKALDLDDSVAEAHTALGVVRTFYEWDWAGARESFERALALNPNSALTHNWYGWYLLFLREWDHGIAELRRAVELDPVSIIMNTDLAGGFQHAGRWNEGIDQARRSDELDPANPWALNTLAWGHVGKKDYQQALPIFQKLVEVAGRKAWPLSGLASVYAFSGDTDRALQLLDEIKERSKGKPGQAYSIQLVYRALATRDDRYLADVYRLLDKALEERSVGLVFASSRWYDGYQSDPRWIAFRKKLGLPP